MEKMQHTPAMDGYHMPGEFEPHKGCILVWPERPGSWPHGAKPAQKAFCEVIRAIAESETVYLAVSSKEMTHASEMLADVPDKRLTIFEAQTDDAWARDIAPTFVVPKDKTGSGVRAVNWSFNAWGGEYNGLYASWDRDNAFAGEFANRFCYDLYDAEPFVLEGGSIHSDGEGTVLVTESCLLSKGRNPQLSKAEIEEKLKAYLGAEKVIWLPRGIYMDETDEHVDNVCAFIKPGEVVLAWTDDPKHPQYELSHLDLAVLEAQTDARGRRLVVHKLPVPSIPVRVREEDLEGYVFEAGEDEREVGEMLAASYVNFYFSNALVVMPGFGGENEESDKLAYELMKKWCPEREICMIPARDILAGGGNIHCITQQIPLG